MSVSLCNCMNVCLFVGLSICSSFMDSFVLFLYNFSGLKIVLKLLFLMVLISDGNSEIGAHVGSNLCYLFCLRHSVRSRAGTNRILNPKMPIFLLACATCSELPSNISSIMLYRESENLKRVL